MLANKRTYTAEEENFLIQNWPYMSASKLAKAFNTKFNTNLSKHAVDSKIGRMNLPKKRNYTINDTHEEIELEIEGRKKTIELNRIRSSFNLNEYVKVRVTETITKPVIKILEGKVVDKTKDLIAVKTGNYRESFKYTDFYTGRAVVI